MNNTIPVTPTDRFYFRRHILSIPMHLILTLVTCGFWNFYWNYRQMEACNDMLGRREFSFVAWILLIFVTCGLWHIFYQYKMGSAIVEIQRHMGKPVFDNLPVLSCLLTVLGVSIVVDIIHQSEINKLAA
jgi:uncharacterized membrane protein YidH (DUF202 family)